MTKIFTVLSILAIAVLFQSCSKKENKDEVVLNCLKVYDTHLRNMNADSLAGMFAENGDLGQEGQPFIAGRADIRNYLNSFGKEIIMMENSSQSLTIDFAGDSAMQKGTYRQKLVIHSDTMDVTGDFNAVWVPDKDKGYVLRKMMMKPKMD
jgi:hypothetical protein